MKPRDLAEEKRLYRDAEVIYVSREPSGLAFSLSLYTPPVVVLNNVEKYEDLSRIQREAICRLVHPRHWGAFEFTGPNFSEVFYPEVILEGFCKV